MYVKIDGNRKYFKTFDRQVLELMKTSNADRYRNEFFI